MEHLQSEEPFSSDPYFSSQVDCSMYLIAIWQWWVQAELKYFQLCSARLVTFFPSARTFFFHLEILIFSFFSSNFLFSPQNLVILRRNSIIYHRIEWKLYCFFLKWLIFGVKKENWSKKSCISKKKSSSFSARKLKCPSSARLGTFIARARSSRKNPARTHH